MNSNIKKLLVAFLATMALFSLSGCGGDGENGTSSQTNLVIDLGGTPLVGVPYTIATHVTNTVTIDSHTVAPTNGVTHTHSWTQVSGPSVAITNGNTALATIIPSATGTVVVLHTVTNTSTGGGTHTSHTVQVVAPPASMQAHVSYAATVPGGLPTTFHVSVAGGTAPYTYKWVQDTGGNLNLDFTKIGPDTPAVNLPFVSQDEVYEYTVTVTDAKGLSTTTAVKFTILASPPLHASIDVENVLYSGIEFQGAALKCNASGGVPAYTYNWGASEVAIDYTSMTADHTVITPLSTHINYITVYCTVTDANNFTKVVSTTLGPKP